MPDAPLEIPQRPPIWSPSPVIEWLLLQGWRHSETGALLRAVCERLSTGGIPVWRTFCAVPSLHPRYFGEAYIWRRGQREVEHSYGMWDLLDTESYRNTPIRLILDEGAGGMRRR
ncbi:MAG TPA: hypothetical protein VFO41_09670, partial [Alphaproteobacteria bacterium]|nr:hypothetical protein [Alphaproteobacteria bacterium]